MKNATPTANKQETRAHRLMRRGLPVLLLLLAALFLGGYLGWRYVAQQWNADQIVRRIVIPKLEKELGQSVEVGTVDTNYWNNVRLHNVVVGKNTALPGGALFRARVLNVSVNIPALVFKRMDALQAISRVLAEEPTIYVERDAHGKFNLSTLLKNAESTPAANWKGIISVRQGTIIYHDNALHSARNEPLNAILQDLTARVQFQSVEPVIYNVSATKVLLNKGTTTGNLHVEGTASPKMEWLQSRLRISHAPATLLTDYLLHNKQLTAQRGTVSASGNINWKKESAVQYNGTARFDNVAGQIHPSAFSLRLASVPVVVRQGEVRFDQHTATLQKLQLRAQDSPIEISGAVIYGIPHVALDLNVRSDTFQFSRWNTWLRPLLPNTQFRGDGGKIALRIAGDTQRLKTTGTLASHQVKLTQLKTGTLSAAALSAGWNGWIITGKKPQANFNVQLKSNGAILQNSSGKIQATAWQGKMQLQDNAGAAGFALQGKFHTAGLSGTTQDGDTFQSTAADIALSLYKSTFIQISGNGVKAHSRQWGDATSGVAQIQLILTDGRTTVEGSLRRFVTQNTRIGKDANTFLLNSSNGENAQFQAAFNGGVINMQGSLQNAMARGAYYDAASKKMLPISVSGADIRVQANTRDNQMTARSDLQNFTMSGSRYDAQIGRILPLSGHGKKMQLAVNTAQNQTVLQGNIRDFSVQDARYGSASGAVLQVLGSGNAGEWRGRIAVKNVNLAQVKLASLSPQLAAHASDLGNASGSAQFAWKDKNPQIAGQISVSQLRVTQNEQKVLLRDIKSTFSYDGNHLQLDNLNAASPYGKVSGEITANLQRNQFVFLVQAPQARFDARELNPYLRGQQITVNGVATGRLLVSGNSADSTQINAKFDLQLPASKVLFKQAQIHVQTAHLRGDVQGSLDKNNTNDWHFDGQMVLSAQNGTMQQATSAARLGRFRVTAQGAVHNDGNNLQPHLQGTFSSGAAKVDISDLHKSLIASDTEAKWQWQNNTLSLPRLHLKYAGGVVDGHFTLADNNQIEGAFLGQNLQVENIVNWLKTARPGLVDQINSNGITFVKAAVNGTVKQPKIALDGQIYDGDLQWNNNGEKAHLPLDVVKWQTHLQLPKDKSTFDIPLEQLTVWSGGTRLGVTGNLRYLSDQKTGKSTFAYNTQVELDGLQLAKSLRNWPFLNALTDWQQRSNTDGALNARLHVTGEGAAPQIAGTVGIKLAQSYDTSLRDVQSQISATFNDGKPIVHLTNLTGKIAQAPFDADIKLDGERGEWAAKADITDIDAFELLDFSEDFAQGGSLERGDIHLSRLPLRGKVTAHFQANGKADFTASSPQFDVSDGTVSVTSPRLLWRDEVLGVLAANFQLKPDVVQIQQANLVAEDATPPRRVALSGTIPWNGDSTKLNAHLDIDNARLSFMSLLLDQTRQVWRRTGNSDAWKRLIQWKNDLPPDTEGNLSLNAHLQGKLNDPQFEVASFKMRDASARTPGLWGRGPVHPLPDVDAAGIYDNGVITINQLEARLPSSKKGGEDLLFHTIGTGRVDVNGNADVDVELLHGNLQDLSPWIPALRNDDGSSALQGEVEQIAVHVEGPTAAPRIIGSVEADNLAFRGYTLNRLRVSRFDISDGKLFIRPGNFTIVKGDYQSSTGWGYLPWNWGGNGKPVGLARDEFMEVHLPLQDRDFGALVGTFIPAVTGAQASTFRGSIDITGTMNAPRLNGIAAIRGGKLALKTTESSMGGGITDLSGTLSFTGGNTLQIDAEDPLRGKLMSISGADIPQTGNKPKSTFAKRPQNGTTLNGAFQLTGRVALNMDALRFTSFRRDLASHHYDLQLLLHDATLSSKEFSGFRHANLAALWKTDAADPVNGQRVRWLVNAEGVNQKGDAQGDLLGFGDFTLDPEFAVNTTHLFAVHSNKFTNAADFASLKIADAQPLFSKVPFQTIEGNTSSIQFHHYAVAAKDIGNGQFDGTLYLQNGQDGKLETTGKIELSNSRLTALPAQVETGAQISWPNTPHLNVQFDIGDNVQFTSSNLQATLGGNAFITGTPLDPLVLSSLIIRRGQAIFPGARARITEGEIDVTIRRDLLSGQLITRTDIDATAEGRSGRYLITLHLHGPLALGQNTDQTLLVDVSSDPPLSRDEAFAQLLGTAVLNANHLEDRDQAYAQMVIGMLSGPLFSGLENTLAETFGLSSIALDYRLDEPLGIEVGKAIGDRLYLSYRRSLGSNPGEPTPYEFRLEYRIKGNWNLGIKTNEKDQRMLTLEKKWRF